MDHDIKSNVLLFAAGRGIRMGAEVPKQFIEVDNKPILIRTMEIFQDCDEIDGIYLVVLEEYIDYARDLSKKSGISKLKGIVNGGPSSQDSIYNGLKYMAEKENLHSIVLIHDGVRPFVERDVIKRNIDSVRINGSAITCIPAFETIIMSDNHKKVENTTRRENTFVGQAPQSFWLEDVLKAHEEIRKRPERYDGIVDSCSLMSELGINTVMVEGNRGNIKVTTPEDLVTYKAFLDWKNNGRIQ